VTPLNVSEGMRRLGLVAGALGACAGALVAYVQLQPLLKERAEYKSFHSLVSSPVVAKEVAFLRSATAGKRDRFGGVPVQPDRASLKAWDENGKPIQPRVKLPPRKTLANLSNEQLEAYRSLLEQKAATESASPPYDEFAALCGSEDGWSVKNGEGGIKSIYFDGRNCDATVANVRDIETSGGDKVHRIDPPGIWAYVLIPLFPVLGFFLPWGTIRTLTWIGLGFVHAGDRDASRERGTGRES